jgi:uncharacterized protein YfaS (alpha-2-macroglobulin family)
MDQTGLFYPSNFTCMRKLTIAIFICSFSFLSANAQTIDSSFEKEWAEINRYILEKKLPKSALQKVDALYKKAKASKLPIQQIRALLYKSSLQDEISDKDVNATIQFWKKELAATNDKAAKAIIQLILAKNYCKEYSNNYWKYNDRTETIAYKPADVETWTRNNFASTIDSLLQNMLKQPTALQQVKLKDLDAILINGEVQEARPTLFDLLAFEAIDCYTKFNQQNTEEPWNASNGAFSSYPAFMSIQYKTKDSMNFINSSLEIFQQVMKFHEKDKDPSAFIDANIQRIVWAKQHVEQENKDELYKHALQQIIGAGANEPAADEAWWLMAKLHKEKTGSYSPNRDTANRYEMVTAFELINKRLQQQTKPSYGRKKLLELEEEIQQKFISSKLESVNLPNQPFRLFVSYTNTDTLHYRIIKIADGKGFETGNNDYWYKLAKLRSFREGIQVLPATHDYQNHNVELKIDALPIGSYMLLASTGKGFVDSTNRLCRVYFTVSSLSYIKNDKDYFVLNRETGQPIANAVIKVIADASSNNKSLPTVMGTAVTDKNGFANLSKFMSNDQRYYSLQLIKGNDTLTTTGLYNYSYNNSTKYSSAAEFEQRNAKAFFFMDRSIYRPGQTVHYKALLTTNDSTTGNHKRYLPKKAVTVYLMDVNNKALDSVKTKTNTYGSINGNFKLPQNVLTGQFHIAIKDFSHRGYFNVEEYKRPTFFVELDKQTSTYKLNDSIKVTGTVKGYAGNTLNNAKIIYVVNRNARFIPYWGGWGKLPYYPNYGNSKQIVQGNLTTDANGKFELSFKAIPEEKQEKDSSIVFDFNVNIAATDVSGETREENTAISIGYKSLLLESSIAEINEARQLKDFPIETNNLSGNKVPAKVQVKIYSLETPTLPTRSRYWEAPDQFVMSEAEYKKHFPYDAYKDEDDHTKWKKLQLADEGSINTKTDSVFTLNKQLPQGWYAIEMLATDSAGNETSIIAYTQLYESTAAGLPSPSNKWEQLKKASGFPKDTASILIGTSLKDVFVIGNIKRKKGNELINQKEESSYQFFQLNNSKKEWQQKLTAADRNGLGMYYAFVKHNRFYQGGNTITVHHENKTLDISYASYRNKTEPGSKETWSIKIKNTNNEKVAAELVTAMYDASLDQFKNHYWNQPDIWFNRVSFTNWEAGDCFRQMASRENNGKHFGDYESDKYNRLAEEGSDLWNEEYLIGTISHAGTKSGATMMYNGGPGSGDRMNYRKSNGADYISFGSSSQLAFRYDADGFTPNAGIASYSTLYAPSVTVYKYSPPQIQEDDMFIKAEIIKKNQPSKIQPRKNFSETAFFFPNLYADTAGNYTFSFTMPEALTQWKWLSFAHTKDLAFGTNETLITTQKTLMVQPNAPRFMREGDNMEFVAKVSNTSDKEITGQASLELVDATNNNSVDGWFQNSFPAQYFTVAARQSTVVKFPIQVPSNYNKPLTWRVVAKAGEFSDGEENTLPVLTNRMLVTETLPLYLKAGEKEKSFTFNKLLNNKSESLTHEGITVEYTANPVWSVVQSLPYLMEFPYECAEQTFNRLFANALAASIVNKHPKIKEQFEKWKKDTTAMQSSLQKNEELKQVLLQETPWVLNAENEQQQKKNIALLFDVVKMSQNIDAIMEKIGQMQSENGGFAWFKGGNEDRYITNYILTGIGKLKKANALSKEQEEKMQPIITKALDYLDGELKNEYDNIKEKKTVVSIDNDYSAQIEYLYMRSFFSDKKSNGEAYNYYYNQAKQYWNKQNTYHAAMIALVLHRNNERRFVNVNILPSLLENTVEDTAKGTLYWKNQTTCFWYQSPIEHQSLMIEAVNEIATKEGYREALQKVDAAKTWLLLNKQTNNWKTTIATADACYALLNTGSNWTASNQQVQIKLGSQTISNLRETNNEQRVTSNGYIKTRIEGTKVNPAMGNINVTIEQLNNQTVKQSSPSYGAIYWQYFEDLDKITEASSPLSIKKKLFIERNTDKGKVLEPLNDTNQLKVGDKLVVRMELRTDREMEYLHLKDMRAAGTEPINVLSGYKWQEGLGYYEATKDASTNFFIDRMQKGTYVFEYPLYITHTGTFSVGIATIQCMYAPEFSSHSEGIKITVK